MKGNALRLIERMITLFMITVCLLPGGLKNSQAQELPLLTEKAGTFEILSRTDYTSSDCGFSNAEITANLQQIAGLVHTVRQNPVLAENKGFDGKARIYNVLCDDICAYGVPSRISFEFCSWYRDNNGKETRGTIEPPEWSLIINKLIPTGYGFCSDLFNRKEGIFTVPLKKETVGKGIDVYDGECFVIYDPGRPPYWLTVTVDEAFAYVRTEWKNNDDKFTAEEMLRWVEREYSEIPAADRNKPAYFGGNISRVSPSSGFQGETNLFPALMKVNPEYWDKKLPKSVIQFIYFRSITNKEYLRKLKEEYLQKNSTSYQLKRFEESFGLNDIRKLVPLVAK
jgi:hypothetical protein